MNNVESIITQRQIDELRGAYDMCQLLLADLVFNRRQRRAIVEYANRAKDTLKAHGVLFNARKS